MFYDEKRLAYTVRVDTPNPLFAKRFQQAIGGIEGEIRVMLQYLFQGWGFWEPAKYRDMPICAPRSISIAVPISACTEA